MAKPIKLAKNKEFTFKSGGGGTASKYDWNSWFDGQLWQLTKTTEAEKGDFDVDVDAMPPKIKTAARRRYKVVQISRLDADGVKLTDAVIIKARDMTPEEHTAEDLKRAEEKAARAAAGEDEPTSEAA